MMQYIKENDNFSKVKLGDHVHDLVNHKNVWKPNLYKLQQCAPRPKKVRADPWALEETVPSFYGDEYHGPLSSAESMRKLREEGQYLVRRSSGPHYTLSLRFDKRVRHYKLYYDGKHFVKETKKFKTVDELVADGLVTMYIEQHASQYITRMDGSSCYETSPHVTLNRFKRRATLPASPMMSVGPPSEKTHSFKVHTFKGLNWCELCGNFLWGFTAQGVKCEDCGFSAHGKCCEKVPNDCCPVLKQIRGVFGIDLTTLVRAHGTPRPFIVDKCVEEIERRGLAVEGLYRVSGFAEEVETLKLALDRHGEKADMSPAAYENINVITGTLKLYLRLLPLPLIVYDAYPALDQAILSDKEEEQVSKIRDALTLLPTAHYSTLEYLVRHLARVVARKEETKMTALNMATVFAPTLMPMANLSCGLPATNGTALAVIPSLANEITIIETIIKHHNIIFSC